MGNFGREFGSELREVWAPDLLLVAFVSKPLDPKFHAILRAPETGPRLIRSQPLVHTRYTHYQRYHTNVKSADEYLQLPRIEPIRLSSCNVWRPLMRNRSNPGNYNYSSLLWGLYVSIELVVRKPWVYIDSNTEIKRNSKTTKVRNLKSLYISHPPQNVIPQLKKKIRLMFNCALFQNRFKKLIECNSISVRSILTVTVTFSSEPDHSTS